MLQRLDNQELKAAYQHEVHRLLIRQTRVGALLIMFLVPAGSSLDKFALAESKLFWKFFWIRLFCAAVVLLPLALTYTDIGRRKARLTASLLVLAPALTISWMIMIYKGSQSEYYAGLNLVIVGVCLVMPFTVIEAGAYCLTVIASYLLACMIHGGVDGPLMAMNLFFILTTTVMCVTAVQFLNSRRENDFQLRHELDSQNQSLEESYEQLAQLDRLRSQFFANVSHELRTPLTLMVAPVQELLHREPPLPQEVGETLAIVKTNGDRLVNLINELLEVIRLEEATLQLDRQPIDMSTFIAGVTNSIRHMASAKHLTFEVNTCDEPLVILADQARLERVFINLISNAIKFTEPGGRITVRVTREGADSVVEVEDTGIGIADAEQPYVFDRFHQVDGSSTRAHQGLGLGLAIAKELITEHGGQISVDSEVGVGTTFTVRLECADSSMATSVAGTVVDLSHRDAQREEDEPSQAIIEHPPVDEPLVPVGKGDHRVLVVDDEPDMRRYMVTSLKKTYLVDQAADGKTGLEKALAHPPDIILLDLMLPGMDGLDVCRALRQDDRTRHVKIIMVTARIDEGSKLEALERGVDDFLTKPFSMVEVKTRIKNLLQIAASQRDLQRRNQELEETLARLQATESQLIQSEKMNALGTMAAGLLHEINNPLNYSMTAVQLALSQANGDRELSETLNDVHEGMGRIRDIVKDLRAFAYPDQHQQFQVFDLREAAQIALRLTADQKAECNIRLPEQRVMVSGSLSHISQVFVNLFSNAFEALKAVSDGRNNIEVSATPSNGRVTIRVRDEGTGIAPDLLSRVTEPFYTTRDVGQGMGLGLSISSTIVQNHGGTLSIRSNPTEWTEVSFDLPSANEE